MMDFDACISEGLLRRIAPSKMQAGEQLAKSAALLSEAKHALEEDMPNSAVINGYSAMLDAARAVLFRDGWRERSHACVAGYLKAKYEKELGAATVKLFDDYRDKRHRTMYSGDYYPSMEEARRVVKFADEFVQKIAALMKTST